MKKGTHSQMVGSMAIQIKIVQILLYLQHICVQHIPQHHKPHASEMQDRDGARERNAGCHSVARCELISRYSYSFSHFSRMFVYNVLSPQSICIMYGMCPWTRRISRSVCCVLPMIEIVSEFNSLSFFSRMSHPTFIVHASFCLRFLPLTLFIRSFNSHFSFTLFLSLSRSFFGYTLHATLHYSSIL